MLRIFALLISTGILVTSVPALTEVQWTLVKKQGRAYLQGMPDEPEVDAEFCAHCRADGAIDIGMGAESHAAKARVKPSR